MCSFNYNKYQMKSIMNYTQEELVAWCETNKFPKFRAKQILTEIYSSRKFDFQEMTSLPKELRTILDEQFFILDAVKAKDFVSADGTVKFLFEFHSGRAVESVLIPQRDSDNVTICVSSQQGCKLDCKFCATGKLGFTGNLKASEIITQILLSEDLSGKKISNVVFMGMGDPLDNYNQVVKALRILIKEQELFGKNRITLSTAGFPDKIKELADTDLNIKIALSLHSPQQPRRETIMPTAVKWRLPELIKALEYYNKQTKQVITFEYILFDKFNNSDDDAMALRKICSHFQSKINLIQYHNIEFTGHTSNLVGASEAQLNSFAMNLRKLGIDVFIRKSAGEDIAAACGQLAYSEMGE